MDALLIGSAAFNRRLYLGRHAQDVDLIVRPHRADWFRSWLEDVRPQIYPNRFSGIKKKFYGFTAPQDHVNFEVEIAVPGSSAEWFMDRHETIPAEYLLHDKWSSTEVTIAVPGALMAIKRSHLTWPRHWKKHIADYHKLKEAGHTMIGWEDGCRMRHAERLKLDAPRRQPSLAVENSAFFHASEAALQRTYEHDDLHQVVAYYDRPLYERSKPDKSRALLDRAMFEALPLLDRLRTVREETMAIALERRIIPFVQSVEVLIAAGLAQEVRVPQSRVLEAYGYALQRICTTLTRGWFRDFAIEHWPEVREPDVDFVGSFLAAVRSGRLVPKLTPSSETM